MLHVLTGSAKGRKLRVPSGRRVRPTTGRVKQSMFDTLGDLEGLSVLDVFSGTGTLGIEALSRGASSSVFIERDPGVAVLLKENLGACGFSERSTLISMHYEGALKKLARESREFDIIFLDPPYPLYSTLSPNDLVHRVAHLLSPRGIVVIKHPQGFEGIPPERLKAETRSYGDTRVTFLVRGRGE